MTPMQEQYSKMKEQYNDTILLFRLGDFYEAFNEDAVTISKVLGITLTGRGKDESRIPMAGIPYHALPNYLPKLVEANLKIAIADQMTEPIPGQLVERQVNKIITPGTVIDENSLDASKNNFIAAIYYAKDENLFHLAYCDLTTGEFKVFSTDNFLILKNEINKINPSETLCAKEWLDDIKNIIGKRYLQEINKNYFHHEDALKILKQQLNVQTLKGFGIDEDNEVIKPAGALIKYLIDCQKSGIEHIKTVSIYEYSDFMQLDPETIRNLELVFPINFDNKNATVFAVLNECKSSMGQRKLRSWLVNPLINKDMLNERLDAVAYFFDNQILTGQTRDLLSQINDIERIAGRIGIGSASPKDFLALKISLALSQEIIHQINVSSESLPIRLRSLISSFDTEKIQNVTDIISESIAEDAPPSLSEGGIIKEGYNSQVDDLRNIKNNSKQILAEIQQREVLATNIPTLKVSFNKVFGYYIEITRSHIDKVPAHYVRKQTLANAERYIIQELKELEDKILTSEDKLIRLEQELFAEIRNKILEFIPEVLRLSNNIAEIDVISNFAYISKQNRYSKPEIVDENLTSLVDGRHIVVERLAKEFIPNSTEFNNDSFIHILTGPNMSGKSTYIRQVALISLIAQIGCFVPANNLKFKIFDRIFTRVGASDNLAKGESTFMVEMTETANILNNSTENSLVILDEVGRGTSTYDGVAIAWSIIEYLANEVKCKTLFATHYHELIELQDKYKGIKNFNVLVNETDGEVVFMHKIIEGGTDQSYGVHVAKIAGVPEKVVERANEILKTFEDTSKIEVKDSKSEKRLTPRPRKIHPEQMGLI